MQPARFPSPLPAGPDLPLYLQRAGRTLLIGYREEGRWVLARGWRRGDRFTDIRCWRFDLPGRFIAQVGRLVSEEAGPGDGAIAARQAGDWVVAVEESRVG